MLQLRNLLGLASLLCLGVALHAQTTVTTSGGTTSVVPVYTGSSTLGNSPISISGGSVGIGAALNVNSGTSWGTINITSSAADTALFLTNTTTAGHNWYLQSSGTGTGSGGGPGSLSFVDASSSVFEPLVLNDAASYFNNNVGIGTSSPSAKLEVNGGIKLTSGTGGSLSFSDNTVQSTAWTGVLSGGVYAESVNVSGNRNTYEPGDVLVIDPASEGKFLKSSTPYATTVTGIYSTKPGVTGRRQHTSSEHMKEEVPMAMTGIVPTKVSAENGPIKPGDLLVTSSKPGYAMKGTDRSQMLGAVIGKAIGHLSAGTGVIEAVVTLQ